MPTFVKRIKSNPIIQVLGQYPSFSYLFSGQVVSQLGTALHRIALMWLVLQLTGSALKMGTIMMVYTIPWILFGVVAGTFVDRWDRRRVMIAGDLIRAVLVLSVPVLWLFGHLTYPALLVMSFILSSVSTFYQPAKTALLPQVVDRADLMPANSASQAAWQLTNVAGPVFGGVLIGVLGSANVFWLDGVSYIFSALMIMRVRLLPQAQAEQASRLVDGATPGVDTGGQKALASTGQRIISAWRTTVTGVREGWAYLKTEPSLLYVMVLSFFLNFFFAPIALLLPLLANDVLHAGATGYGIISAGFSAGMLVGAVFVGSTRQVRPSAVMGWSLLLQGVFIALVGYSGAVWVATLLLVIGGVLNAVLNVLFSTIFQQMVPDSKLGRVNALVSTASMGAQPLAYALSGWIAELAPVPILFAAIGLTVVISGPIALSIKEFKRFDEVYDELQRQREATAAVDGNPPAGTETVTATGSAVSEAPSNS